MLTPSITIMFGPVGWHTYEGNTNDPGVPVSTPPMITAKSFLSMDLMCGFLRSQ